uniref:CB1 cannabinoid receptor-interacting protein 1 n=1 Tax=Globodera pallida TaxID=36090 RepID=A0A183CM45_GLOPA
MASGGVLMPSGDVPTPASAPKPNPSTAASVGGPRGATVGIGHTIHPKLSLSAKRSVGLAGAAATEMTVDDGQQNAGGAISVSANNSTHFKLNISISDAEHGTPIMFKQDGSRFSTSQRTLKLHSNCKYKVSMQCKPQQDFLSLHIGGSDLELVTEPISNCAGEYTAMWNTTGIDPSRKGIRQDILFVLSGPGKTLNRKLQTKFYARDDGHAGMGHRLEALCWACELDPTGQVLVVDETLR